MQRAWFAGFVAVFVFRLLAESWVRPRQTELRARNRGIVSLQLLSIPFLVSAAATGFWLWRDGPVNGALYWTGLVLFAAGFAGRTSALRTLGRSYSLYIDPAPTEALRTNGLYASVRHPVYAFYLLESLSLALIRPNWISWIALVMIGLACLWRIRKEEAALLVRHGEEYGDYMSRTWRLLPHIW